ncbi:hypothetical protein GCM10008090_35200 [Arenicella chitinivorans]|uniref:Uncharacterized protein n=1 Tax=Arenicella chitinivorans TaxID=1329800 RepID=A0A918S3S1_9GAMM|nr:hypothetical protein GCM10008090_35200 [Arenicella chitinivorans]
MNRLNDESLKQLHRLSARLWDFSPSHDRLTYRINTTNPESEKYLIFIECDAIETLVFWKITNLRISKEGGLLIVEDNDMKIKCKEVFLESGYTLDYFNDKYGSN